MEGEDKTFEEVVDTLEIKEEAIGSIMAKATEIEQVLVVLTKPMFLESSMNASD